MTAVAQFYIGSGKDGLWRVVRMIYATYQAYLNYVKSHPRWILFRNELLSMECYWVYFFTLLKL